MKVSGDHPTGFGPIYCKQSSLICSLRAKMNEKRVGYKIHYMSKKAEYQNTPTDWVINMDKWELNRNSGWILFEITSLQFVLCFSLWYIRALTFTLHFSRPVNTLLEQLGVLCLAQGYRLGRGIESQRECWDSNL